MIDETNFRALALHLGFSADLQEVSDVLCKTYGENGETIRIDFSAQRIDYPWNHGFKVNRADTCNFSSSENAVVLECVHRLLEKGYKPQHIELEPEWKLGHGGKSGRADILVRDQQGTALLIIECKTAGREFEKAWKDTLEDGAQLISYVEQEKATQFICLYASEFDAKAGKVLTSQRIISVKDNPQILLDQPKAQSFKDATNAKERFKAWKETYRQEFTEVGVFEDNIQPYQIGKSKYTFADDTRPLIASDIKGKYHHFRTILRKHNVSRRENAFEVLVNLFVCKIVDEMEHPDDLRFYWKGIAYDNYYDLVDRLQALYKTGMQRFLDQDIVYVSNADIDRAFWPVKKKRNAVKDEIKRLFRELKFFKGMDFEFIKVFNQTYFDRNAKILIEIIQMWQGYRLTGSSQNQFLGDMFEYFLDNGIKQSEGQFFTPVPICKFIVSSLPLEQLIANTSEPLKAIDYACGSGHFLTEYAAQLPTLLRDHKQQANTSKWYASIYGIEKEDRLAKVAKVSAFMYGFNDIHILDADALVRHPDITEEGHDILVANPPFSVEDFLQTVPEDERERYTLLANANDLSNKNVQCFFLERAQQLLKPGAVMGVIVPSSILSNTDGMHVATRQILLKYFDFVAITELGGSTFGKTGTNTVVLFMRRKSERPEAAEHLANRVQDYFEDWATEAQTGGGEYQDLDIVRQYCAHMGVPFEHYTSLLQGQPSAELLAGDSFKDYRRAFDEATETKKRIASKDFQKQSPESQQTELTQRFTKFCREREQNKLFYYLLAAHNPTPVLLVKGPSDNKAQQQFLGYEWSGAKGQEGIRYLGGESVRDIATPLFDPQNRGNASKISHVIRQAFAGQALQIPTELQAYVTQASLTDLLEFGRVEFDAVVSLTVKIATAISSKWPIVLVRDVAVLNPSRSALKNLSPDTKVSFIEMAAVSEEGYIEQEKSAVRPLSDFKGASYTNFTDDDVLIAKITPCMENGKSALVRNLVSGIGFGSTEFHVIRADMLRLLPGYLFVYLNRVQVRKNAEQKMTGSSGHRRVPESFYADLKIPLPPLNIQQKIVDECDAVYQAVEAAKAEIAQARHSVTLAFEQAVQAASKEVKLSNPDLFDIFIGKRVLKSEITHDDSGIPVYSANVLQPFGFTKNQFLDDFSRDSVLWGIDGDWMVSLIQAGTKFYPTDHCGVVRVKPSTGIHPRYLAMALEEEGKRVRFSRSNRAKTEAIKNLKLRFPSPDLQAKVSDAAVFADQTIAAAMATIAAAPAQKQAILQKYL
ncbi:N-6 DNA methylase [Acidovorax sp.]|uniref:N-6 DNA methylase n=1 Tax=Acidovorax sp. TaxID=1872122 RepID=UPI00391F810A